MFDWLRHRSKNQRGLGWRNPQPIGRISKIILKLTIRLLFHRL